MKNVLLLVHDDAGQEARLQGALDLTRALSGHLHCVDVTPLPLVADTIWGAAAGTVLYDESEREERNLARLRERLAGEDVPWTCEALRGDFTSCLMGAVRTADLVVLNRALAGMPNPDMRTVAGNLLAQGDMLVLAVPEDCRGLDAAGPALVAWDGSRAAMDTVRRAVPLLALARSVTLFQAGDLPDDAVTAAEAATYLARHGIKPEVEIAKAAGTPADQIAAAAERIGARYCVMGAYGHSRLREAVFGGVTQKMLGTAGLPLLLGH